MKSIIGKILYGSLYIFVLPISLLAWGRSIDKVVQELPAINSPVTGSILIISGIVLLILGWRALIKYGKGLPMNAFPPKKLVSQEIYAIIPHPIYSGFSLMVFGYSIFMGSVAGLWIVAPATVLCSVALVVGYEHIDMEKRFETNSWQTAIRFPPAEDQKPTSSERVSAYILMFLPWAIVYEAFIFLGPMPDEIDTYFDFEQSIPVIEWTEIIYVFTYLFVLTAPLIAKRQVDLRNYMLMGIGAATLGLLLFFLLPFKATPRPFDPSNIFGQLLIIEQAFDGPAGAFPAFHAVWSFLSAWLYAKTRGRPLLWYSGASLISLSCITTGMHSIIDILGAVVVFIVVVNKDLIWNKLLYLTEWFANSRHEWHFGRVRIINHGFYVGIGSFTGILLAAHLAGTDQVWFVFIVSFSSLAGAGIWGQALEGSSKLSRPFGYYGGLFGGCLGLLFSIALGANGWQIAGAFSIAGPIVQSIGRLRCLVQGCCHGRECSENQGIVIYRKHSRVISIADLGNRHIYPTQLYSIIHNIVLGALLVRMWTLSVPMPFIIGTYLLGGGIGRFIEESYRGEPQTPKPGGLAVYQWLALTCVPVGAIIMTFPGKPCVIEVTTSPWFVIFAGIFGIIVTFAMGIDFPESNKRFSRLS